MNIINILLTNLGFTLTLSISVGQLNIVTSAVNSFKNFTSGLFGIFNSDTTDDLTTPNGTKLDTNLNITTERILYFNFGELCKSIFMFYPVICNISYNT